MEKKLTNSGPFMKSTGKHSIYTQLVVPFLDIHTLLLHDAEWQQLTQAGDGSNPNAQGYAKIAALISAWPAWRAWFDDV
jgi:lysophospholipase L1-like esterase